MRNIALTLTLVAVALAPGVARAQADEPDETPASPAAEASTAAPEAPDPGWSAAAAVVGFAAATVTLGLGITADAMLSDEALGPAFVLEMSAVVAIGALNPVIFAGGRSARQRGDVDGCSGCRIAAWVLFATHAVAAVTVISLGFALDDPLPHGVVSAMVGLGSVSNLLFAIDALRSRNEALRRATETSR